VKIISRTNKNSSCVNEEGLSQRVKKLLQGPIQKRFTKKLFPWPLPCFPAAKAKARGAQMEMHCGVDKKTGNNAARAAGALLRGSSAVTGHPQLSRPKCELQ
jgi:hypothetical protein